IFLLFLAPFSWGTQKREAAAPKASGCFMGGTCAVREEPGKQNPRSCRAQELARSSAQGKCAAEKGRVSKISENRDKEQAWAKQLARTTTKEARKSLIRQHRDAGYFHDLLWLPESHDLLVTQGDHRINAHRPPCGDVAGEE